MDDTTKPKTDPVAEPTLEERAARITQDYLAIVTDEGRSNRGIVDRAIRIGKDLLDLKSRKGEIPHGEWKKWVKNNLPQFNEKKVQRWMNLAKNEGKIRAAIAKLEGSNKKDTVSFLTLRQALAIANEEKEKKDPPPVRKRFTAAMEGLVDLLPEFESVESAEEYADKARQRLDQTLDSMRKKAA
jgi:hypothetical protein